MSLKAGISLPGQANFPLLSFWIRQESAKALSFALSFIEFSFKLLLYLQLPANLNSQTLFFKPQNHPFSLHPICSFNFIITHQTNLSAYFDIIKHCICIIPFPLCSSSVCLLLVPTLITELLT